jgi:hypothetical protein
LVFVRTQSRQKHTAEPVQSGTAIAPLKSFNQRFSLVDCLKGFRRTIR